MNIEITMSALAATAEEVSLVRWMVSEGDSVRCGDVIAEVETDKALMEVESVADGKVVQIVVPEGSSGVGVNTVIAIVASEGREEVETKSGALVHNNSAPDAVPAPVQAPIVADVALALANRDRIFSSPAARKLAREAGIDLAAVSGTGPLGRIIKSDIEIAIASVKDLAAAHLASDGAERAPVTNDRLSDETLFKVLEPGSYERVPHDGMRRTIARRLVESKQSIPHFYVTIDCELDSLLALREQLNLAAPTKDGEPAYRLSVNDMVVKAMALALRDVPEANVSWTSDAMVRHRNVDIGVAVSIPGGLLTPIIRNAEQKTLSAISNELKDLGKRAKERKLRPEEYEGGTSSVSNLGMMGIKQFAAVINPPQATILAVGIGEQRVVVRNGEMTVATVMSVTLSTDHRCVDGALGAELLRAFKGYVESPITLLA